MANIDADEAPDVNERVGFAPIHDKVSTEEVVGIEVASDEAGDDDEHHQPSYGGFPEILRTNLFNGPMIRSRDDARYDMLMSASTARGAQVVRGGLRASGRIRF